MDKKDKNKNASHLTHKMKKEHGGLLEASKKAAMQLILKAKEGYKQAAEGCKKAAEAKEAEAKENLVKFVKYFESNQP
ncbi:hypothetical protein TH0138_11320 [Helicobacter pylori]|nr:hypothetical protein VN0484_14170 [Helicobacter pylori]GHR74452.1 hypothetical protein VN0645_03530 [Helicobacter pylori]